jgi:hypothetical protein
MPVDSIRECSLSRFPIEVRRHDARRFEFAVERAVFLTVLHRLIQARRLSST